MSCHSFETTLIGLSVGYNITPFQIWTCVLAVYGVLVIFFQVPRALKEEYFSLYLGFCLLSAFTLLLTVVQRMLPLPAPGSDPSASRAYGIGLEAFLGGLIALQWFVQTGSVYFLLVKNPGNFSLWRVFFLALATALTLLVPWIVTLALGAVFYGEVVDEGLLTLFFGAVLLIALPPFRKCVGLSDFVLQPRPMMAVWAGFMLASHAGFLVMYTVRGVWPGHEVGSCFYILVDSLYYALYPVFFMFVVRRDSSYWRAHGSLLLDMQLALDGAAGSDLYLRGIAEIPLIKFNELEFKRKIGSGSFAEVYAASWQKADVAVKIFRVAHGQLETMNELLREARLMFDLGQHPNVMQLLGIAMRGQRVAGRSSSSLVLNSSSNDDVDEEDGAADYADGMLDLSQQDVLLCAVLRFASNGSLFDWIHGKQNVSWDLRLGILHDICTGMAFLHDQGVIHRDLKSANVLLDGDMRALISDFGLSRPNVAGTVTMSAIGTPHWMAPETLRGERYSQKADVWAFGVICWEVVLRRVPYDDVGNSIVVMQRVAHEGLRLSLDVESPLRPILDDCLAEDPHNRPTFADLAERVSALRRQGS